MKKWMTLAAGMALSMHSLALSDNDVAVTIKMKGGDLKDSISRDMILKGIENFSKKSGNALSGEQKKEAYKYFTKQMAIMRMITLQAKANHLDKDPNFDKRLNDAKDRILAELLMKSIEEQADKILTNKELLKQEEEKAKKEGHYSFDLRLGTAGYNVVKGIEKSLASEKKFFKLIDRLNSEGNKIDIKTITPEMIPSFPKELMKIVKSKKVGEIIVLPDEKKEKANFIYIAAKKPYSQDMIESLARERLRAQEVQKRMLGILENFEVNAFDAEGRSMKIDDLGSSLKETGVP